MPPLNCGGKQSSTMPGIRFADTRSSSRCRIELNYATHLDWPSSWYLCIPTFSATLDTTFEEKRASMPAVCKGEWQRSNSAGTKLAADA
jgi:hypothetical protein